MSAETEERELMNAGLPKIWTSAFYDHSHNIRNIDFRLPNNGLDQRVALGRAAKWPDGNPLTPELVPDYIFFDLYDLTEKYRSRTPDWFWITGGVHIVSEKFRDFLAGFDLGTNQFFEAPLYEFDQKTRRPGRWFVFHICETKDTLVAEQSTGLEQRGMTPGFWRSYVGKDVLAVRASAAEGADLWIDLHILGRIFLSDRLKAALRPAGIRVPKIDVRPCVVVA